MLSTLRKLSLIAALCSCAFAQINNPPSPNLNGVPLDSLGLTNILNYSSGIAIGDGAVHTVGTAPVGSAFFGVTTVSGLAAVSINGATPFSWITSAPFSSGVYVMGITAIGSGGTGGTFSFVATGGGCSVEPTGTFTVGATGTEYAGSVTSMTLSTRGSGCTSAPAIDLTASASLVGATITATVIADSTVANLDIAWLAAETAELAKKAYYPAGTYIIGSAMALPLYRPETSEAGGATDGATTMGDGTGVSVIQAGSDWGFGLALYNCGDPSATFTNGLGRYGGGNYSGIFQDITLKSSAGTPLFAIGADTIQMDGMKWGSRLRVLDVRIAGFQHNFNIVGDHTRIIRLTSQGGVTGVYWDRRSTVNFGDVTFDDLNSSGQSKASIGVNGNASIAGAVFNGETYLSGPIAIRGEAGACDNLFNTVHFDYIFAEFLGNAFISDENGLSASTWTDANKCKHIVKLDIGRWFQSYSNSNLWTTGGRGRRATIDAAQMNLTTFEMSGAGAQITPPAPSSGPSVIAAFNVVKTTVDGFAGTSLRGDIAGWISQSGTTPLIVCNGSSSCGILSSPVQIEWPGKWKGIFNRCSGSGNYTTTTSGDIVVSNTLNAVPGGANLVSMPLGVVAQTGLTCNTTQPYALVPIITTGESVSIPAGFQSAPLPGLLKVGTGIGPTLTLTAAGSGGTNGTFNWTSSGGSCQQQPTGTFTVTGGVVTATTIATYGYSCTSGPTISTSASAGLTGATLTPRWPPAIGILATSVAESGILGTINASGGTPGSGTATVQIVMNPSGGGGQDNMFSPPANYCTDAGTTNAYSCSMPVCFSTYAQGPVYWVKASSTNTGATTLALCGLAAKTIKKWAGAAKVDLIANDIGSGQWAGFVYDGTSMLAISPLGGNYATATNCASGASPAVCASASAGRVAVPTGANPTLVVNTSAVTANSEILLAIDETLGTALSVTCNTTLTTLVQPVVTARTAGTSFTIQIGATLVTNPACVGYHIVN